MTNNLFYQPLIQDGILFLDAEESRHCVKVLRKKHGDAISLTDGKGYFYEGIITKADSGRCFFEIHQQSQVQKKKFFIHIAISPTKNADRIEWFVEKATEFGVDQISLIKCKNTERSFVKTERLLKVAISAMKQSVKAVLPAISNHTFAFEELVENCGQPQKYIAFVDHTNSILLGNVVIPHSAYCVLIGPEGDFTLDELHRATENGFKKISLGRSRLRTETAGIAACHILNLMNANPV